MRRRKSDARYYFFEYLDYWEEECGYDLSCEAEASVRLDRVRHYGYGPSYLDYRWSKEGMRKSEAKMAYRVIITGEEGFDDYEFLAKRLDRLLSSRVSAEIFSAEGEGERLWERYARDRGYPLRRFPTYVERWGSEEAAIAARNRAMVRWANEIVVFGECEEGLMELAEGAELRVRVVHLPSATNLAESD